MRVDAERDARVGVAGYAGELEDVGALGDQLRDGEVTEVVETEVLDAGSLEGGIELALQPPVRRLGLSELPWKDEIVRVDEPGERLLLANDWGLEEGPKLLRLESAWRRFWRGRWQKSSRSSSAPSAR